MLQVPTVLLAQQLPGRRVEVGGDVHWFTGMQAADANAIETAPGGATRTVFKSTTRFGQAACPEARVAVAITSLLDGEASFAVGRTHLTTQITGDPEASDSSASEPVTEYLFEAGVAAHLTRWHRGRAAPFVSGGVGYLRQLHDGHTLVEGGRTFYAGGGLRYLPKDDTARGVRSAGLRVELRATILSRSLTLDGATHVLPAVIGGLFFHF